MNRHLSLFFFFFNDTATTEIYTLSLHDALPIYLRPEWFIAADTVGITAGTSTPDEVIDRVDQHIRALAAKAKPLCASREAERSEEHTSELQSPDHLVCRLLLEKKKIRIETRTTP